jgi:hypothetical protein
MWQINHLAEGNEKLEYGEPPDTEAEESWTRSQKVKIIREADKQKKL